MSLSTIQTVAQRGGFYIRIIDELLGTGDNAQKSFDVANDQLITGTYVVNYAPATGASTNSFTAMIDVTDYALDLESGRILLTSAGLTKLSTNKLYITYSYLTYLTIDQVSQFITKAEQRVIRLTGKTLTSAQLTEYYDGVPRSNYPHTDKPFQIKPAVYDALQLNNYPVSSVDEVTFLDRATNTFTWIYSYDGSTYTDNTTEGGSPSGTAFNTFAASPATNNAIYFGMSYKFLGVLNRLQQLGVDGGSLAVTWEYYNGSSWASLPSVVASVTGANKFTANGKVTWNLPDAWATTTVNGSQAMYFVRARLSAGSYSTVPKSWEHWPDPDGVISQEISLRNVDVTSYGKLRFLTDFIVNGVRNIRVKYTAGISTSDDRYELFKDLEDCLAALQGAVAITGGNFDNENSFKIGEKSVTVGEFSTNIEEVIQKLQGEILAMMPLIGKRYSIA